MKKLILSGLAVSLALTLVGCGGKAATPPQPAQPLTTVRGQIQDWPGDSGTASVTVGGALLAKGSVDGSGARSLQLAADGSVAPALRDTSAGDYQLQGVLDARSYSAVNCTGGIQTDSSRSIGSGGLQISRADGSALTVNALGQTSDASSITLQTEGDTDLYADRAASGTPVQLSEQLSVRLARSWNVLHHSARQSGTVSGVSGQLTVTNADSGATMV